MVHIPKSDKPLVDGIYADYDISTTLGTGAFATVKKAIHRETGKPYAVKMISKNKITDGDAVQREIKILKQLKNPYVVGMNDFYEDRNYFYLVMDYVRGGDLMDFVLQNGSVPEPAAREIIRQICEAVKYVHSLGISHRDLKPDNILIVEDSPVTIKVSDFGLAKITAHESVLKTFCGTLAYLAPEVMETKGKRNNPKVPCYSNLVDMWSIGCLAFVILTSYLPFDGSTQDNLFANVMQGNYNRYLLEEKGVSKEGIEIIDALLQVQPMKRPSAAQALQFKWLTPFGAESDSAPDEQFSTMNIDSGSSSLGRDTTVRPDSKDNGNNDNNKENALGNAPDLTNDSDSDIHDEEEKSTDKEKNKDKNTEANTPVPEATNTPFKTPKKFSIRDMEDDFVEVGYPDGTWLILDTRGDSIPCQNIGLRMKKVVFGRGNVDVDILKDPRISKQHCIIERVPATDDGKEAVWLTDTSSNGCYVNGIRLGARHKVQLRDGDKFDLFSDIDDKGDPTFMGYSVKFVGESLVNRETEKPHPEVDENVTSAANNGRGGDSSMNVSGKLQQDESSSGRKRPRQLNSQDSATMRPLKKVSMRQ